MLIEHLCFNTDQAFLFNTDQALLFIADQAFAIALNDGTWFFLSLDQEDKVDKECWHQVQTMLDGSIIN